MKLERPMTKEPPGALSDFVIPSSFDICHSSLTRRDSSAAVQHDKNMKICDLTQFYSPVSGGVKRYLHEKIDYVQNCTASDKHVLVVPGPKSDVQVNGRSRIYTIRSPLVSRAAKYRALLNLRAVEEILDRERPDVIESADPYQLGWKALRVGRTLSVTVYGFFTSPFHVAC